MKRFSTMKNVNSEIGEMLGDSTKEDLDLFIRILKEKGYLTQVPVLSHTFELADMTQAQWDECVNKTAEYGAWSISIDQTFGR